MNPRLHGKRLSCRPEVDFCQFCEHDINTVDGCVDILIRGRSRLPVDFSDHPDPGDGQVWFCRCGAMDGEYHHYGCTAEYCPWHSEDDPDDRGPQIIGCGCYCDGCGDHPPGPCTHVGDTP